MKKLLPLFLSLCLLLCLTACDDSKTTPATSPEELSYPDSQSSTSTSSTTSSTTPTESKQTESSITYSKVLARGMDKNGDVYELVADEEDSYAGTVVQVGVLKNGKWLQELTSDMPFVDKDGTIYGAKITTIDSSNLKFFYIGNGCFLCESYSPGMYDCMENIIYNSETQQYFEKKFTSKDKHICITFHCLASWGNLTPDYTTMKSINKQHSLVITNFANYAKAPEIELLDTNKMTTKTIKLTLPEEWWEIGYIYPISEGVFAVTDKDANQIAFYDENGVLLFDEDYALSTKGQSIVFVDGKCTFTIRNNANKNYQITVDKNGNVLESVEL